MEDVRYRFGIRFGRVMGVFMRLLGAGPKRSYVEVDGDVVRARMGWMFRGDIPRSAIVEVRPQTYVWWAYGVHGWHGRWIVNGSGHDVVAMRIEPAARARVLGVPVRLRELWVSLDDPEGFRTAVTA